MINGYFNLINIIFALEKIKFVSLRFLFCLLNLFFYIYFFILIIIFTTIVDILINYDGFQYQFK